MTIELGPRVFISYSHDSEEHRTKVLDLADRLCDENLDCWIDRYIEDATPERGWPMWMEENVRVADFILVICTETFLARFEGREEVGKGLGVKFESVLMTQHIYQSGSVNRKIIPVVVNKDDSKHIPSPLVPFTYYNVGDEAGFLKLYRRLTNQPEIVRPPIGPKRILLPVDRSKTVSTQEPTAENVPTEVVMKSEEEETLPLIPDFTDSMRPSPNFKIAHAFFGQSVTRRFAIASQLELLEPGETQADINREDVSSQILIRAMKKGKLAQLWSALFNESLDPNPFK